MTKANLSIDGALRPWIDNLTAALLGFRPVDPTEILPKDQFPEPRAVFRALDLQNLGNTATTPKTALNNAICMRLESKSRLTSNNWFQDVRHVVLRAQTELRKGSFRSLIFVTLTFIVTQL